MSIRNPTWRGWPWAAAIVAGLLAAWTLRHGVVPGGDGVSYWSAAHGVADGHVGSSGLIPAFSDLSYRSLVDDGRAPFVDFPIGYPLLLGAIGLASGIKAAQVLAMLIAVAATAWLIVSGPHRASSWTTLSVRALAAWTALGLPIAVELRQGGLPEPVFVSGLLAFALLLGAVGRDGSRLWPAAALGGALGVLRFVGLPLVAVLAVQAWRGKVRGARLAAAVALCASPGVLNAMWASGQTDRSPQWMSRGSIDFKFAAHSLAGWVTTFNTSVADVLDGPWEVPTLYYLLGAVLLGIISWGALRWLGGDHGDTGGVGVSHLVLALSAALLGAVLITMYLYDALTKFEPRMLYPPGVLLITAWAWADDLHRRVCQRIPHAALGVSMLWAVAAARPDRWEAPRFVANAERLVVVSDSAAAVVISNSADTIHYESGVHAAYFPSPINVHSGRAQDRDALMDGFACSLGRADGVVLLDGSGFLPPDAWIVDQLAAMEAAGTLAVEMVSGSFTLYRPTETACVGR